MNMLSSSALDSLTIKNRLVSLDNVRKIYEQNLSLFPFHIEEEDSHIEDKS